MNRTLSLLLIVGLAACNKDAETDSGTTLPSDPPTIAGNWLDDFGVSHTIDDTQWVMSSGFTYLHQDWSNEEGWLIALNDAANPHAALDYSRFEWIEHEGATWVCQVVYDSDSLQATYDAESADASNPDESGCDGYSWTRLDPA